MRAPKPVTMWAAVSPGSSAYWLHAWTVRPTRREARAAFYGTWEDEDAAKRIMKRAGIKFVRVTVAVQEDQ